MAKVVRSSMLLLLLAAFAVAPSGLADTVPPGGGGAPVSCYANGTTVLWSGYQTVDTPACLSNQTAFYGYKSGAGTVCQFAGYRAFIYYVSPTSQYINRLDTYWCLDGFWHFSSKWSYDERRFSEMRISAAGANWSMIQYK